MGGNALKTIGMKTVRLSKKEYDKVVDLVEKKVNEFFEKNNLPNRTNIIQSYFHKSDFGDLDILIEDFQNNSIQEKLLNTLSPFVSVSDYNSPVKSIPCRTKKGIFQVDLIFSRPENFDFTSKYYAFNDLGNLVGQVSRNMGLKFGSNGLIKKFYDPYNPSKFLFDYVITRDWDKALKFLGYDPELYRVGENGGFKGIRDIFEFIASSEFFNSESFLLSSRNHKGRTRDAKRKTYSKFLEWIDSNKFNFAVNKQNNDLNWIEDRLHDFFPDYQDGIDKANKLREIHETAKRIFSGKIVSENTGLTGENLGLFIAEFRGERTKDEFKEYIASFKTKENIVQKINELYKQSEFNQSNEYGSGLN